jgi:hypothetical protein
LNSLLRPPSSITSRTKAGTSLTSATPNANGLFLRPQSMAPGYPSGGATTLTLR